MTAMLLDIKGTNITFTTALAVFCATPQKLGYYYTPEGGAIARGVNAGLLKLNADSVDFFPDNTGGIYYEFGNGQAASTTWELTGLSPFTSFTTMVSRGFPAMATPNFLPDSASLNGGLQLQWSNNYSNADSIFVFVGDGNSTPLHRHLPGNANSVTFMPAEMAKLSAGRGEINMQASNYSNETVNGKNYLYIQQRLLSSSLILY